MAAETGRTPEPSSADAFARKPRLLEFPEALPISTLWVWPAWQPLPLMKISSTGSAMSRTRLNEARWAIIPSCNAGGIDYVSPPGAAKANQRRFQTA